MPSPQTVRGTLYRLSAVEQFAKSNGKSAAAANGMGLAGGERYLPRWPATIKTRLVLEERRVAESMTDIRTVREFDSSAPAPHRLHAWPLRKRRRLAFASVSNF